MHANNRVRVHKYINSYIIYLDSSWSVLCEVDPGPSVMYKE